MQEIVNLIVSLILSITCVLLLDLCYAKLNNYKFNLTKSTIVLVLLTAILSMINTTLLNFNFKPFVATLIICLNYKFIFKDNLKKIISNYLIIYLLLIIFEIFYTNMFAYLQIINNSTTASKLTLLNLFLSILVQITEYLLLIIKPINNFFQKVIKIIFDKINFLNIVLLFLILLSILGMLNIELFATKGAIKLLASLFILFFILFIFIFKLKLQEEALKINNKKLVQYNEKYGKFLDEYKIYKHNINHKLSAMKPFGNKKINSLIDELLNEENNFDIKNNNLYSVPDGIKGIVAEKLYNVNIEVIINNKIKNDPFKKLSSKVFHSVSECLGIALDNAIEACKETDNPIIIMDLIEEKEIIRIKVGNNFSNNINLEKLGDKYYSTKNRGSGLGLFSIMRNNLVKEKISIINDFYYIELQIKKAR